MTSRQRADRLLVSRDLFESRALAQAAINAGLVTADGILVRKVSQEISANAALIAERPHPYVSRGGIKFAAALDHYRVDVTGPVPSGFMRSTSDTDSCMLRSAAVAKFCCWKKPISVRLSRRGSLIRSRPLSPGQILGFDQRDNCRGRLQEIGDCGQHQLQRNERLPRCRRIDRRFARRDAKKGIVRSESARASACQEIAAWLRRQGWLVEDPIPPPILGGDGNVECLIEAARG